MPQVQLPRSEKQRVNKPTFLLHFFSPFPLKGANSSFLFLSLSFSRMHQAVLLVSGSEFASFPSVCISILQFINPPNNTTVLNVVSDRRGGRRLNRGNFVSPLLLLRSASSMDARTLTLNSTSSPNFRVRSSLPAPLLSAPSDSAITVPKQGTAQPKVWKDVYLEPSDEEKLAFLKEQLDLKKLVDAFRYSRDLTELRKTFFDMLPDIQVRCIRVREFFSIDSCSTSAVFPA